MPSDWGLVALLVCLAWAIGLTYHELCMEKVSLRKQLDDKAAQRRKRDMLGEAIMQGLQLLREVRDTSGSPPQEEVAKWATRVWEYLMHHVETSFAARFLSDADLPPGFTTLLSPEHARIEAYLGKRLTRLEQFLRELGERPTLDKEGSLSE